jgi:GT2 family glycosyltransferase
MKFIFIAVNFNGYIHTKNYLDSIRALKRQSDDVVKTIIVDNNSLPQDVCAVRDYLSESLNEQMIELTSNIGYFKGLNAGISVCDKRDETFLIVGNNDIVIDETFIQNLKLVDLDPDVQLIAPNVITLDGRQQNPHVITGVSRLEKIKATIYFSNYHVAQVLRLINFALKRVVSKGKKGPSREAYSQMKIKRGIGACYVLPPAFFKMHEKLDDRVFLWGEEALLSHQIESAGGTTLYAPSLKITHCESASVRFIETRKRYDIVKKSYKIYKKYL